MSILEYVFWFKGVILGRL